MDRNSYTLGIDFGTTSLSLVLIDTHTREVVKQLSITHKAYIIFSESWRREQNLAVLEKCLYNALEQILPFAEGNIDSIGLTGQQHGIIGLDSEGKAMTNLITWQDESTLQMRYDGQSIVGQMKQLLPGLSISAGFGLATLYKWVNIEKRSEIVRFTDVADYFGRILTQNFASNSMHPSMAHSMGAFDVFSNSWDLSSLHQLNLAPRFFPSIVDGSSPIGFTSLSGKIKNIPVYLAIGDNQASFLGTVAHTQNAMLINIGTGAQISIAIDLITADKITVNNTDTEIRPFIGSTFLLSTSFISGGGIYKCLHDFFEGCAVQLFGLPMEEVRETLWQNMEKIGATVSSNDELLNVYPLFSGTRSQPTIRGSISNIGTDNFTPGNLIFSTLMGMARTYKEAIPNEILKQVLTIYGSGNGIKQNALMGNILSEVFEKQIIVSGSIEEAAFGAALWVITNQATQ